MSIIPAQNKHDIAYAVQDYRKGTKWVQVENALSPDDASTLTSSTSSSTELSSLEQEHTRLNKKRTLDAPRPLAIFDPRSATAKSVWLLEHAYSMEELNVSSPPLCGEIGCGKIAHALWASIHGDTLQFCMGCQLRVMFGFATGNLTCDPSRRKPYAHEIRCMKRKNCQRVPQSINDIEQKEFHDRSNDDEIVSIASDIQRKEDDCTMQNSKSDESKIMDIADHENISNSHEINEDTGQTEKHGMGEEMSTDTNEENKEEDNDDKDDDSIVNDDGGDDENWAIIRVYTCHEIRSKTKLCDRDNCELPACILWRSSKGKWWKGCIDCQKDEFSLVGEWPIKEKPALEALKDKPLMLCIYRHCKAERGRGIIVSRRD